MHLKQAMVRCMLRKCGKWEQLGHRSRQRKNWVLQGGKERMQRHVPCSHFFHFEKEVNVLDTIVVFLASLDDSDMFAKWSRTSRAVYEELQRKNSSLCSLLVPVWSRILIKSTAWTSSGVRCTKTYLSSFTTSLHSQIPISEPQGSSPDNIL